MRSEAEMGGQVQLGWHGFLALLERVGVVQAPSTEFDCPACHAVRAAGIVSGEGSATDARWSCGECGAGGGPAALLAYHRGLPESLQSGEADDVLRELVSKGLYFGRAEHLDQAARIYVTAGLVDYLALMEATRAHPELLVVGMLGLDSLDDLFSLLPERPQGLRFVLCHENDEHHKGRLAFERLAKELKRLGARVRLVRPPARYQTFEEWLIKEGLPIRAPKATSEGYEDDGEYETGEAEPSFTARSAKRTRAQRPGGEAAAGAGPPPNPANPDALAEVVQLPGSTDVPLGKSYASLTQILRTPTLAVFAIGERALEFNEMLSVPTLDRRSVTDDDYARARDGIERNIRSTWTKKRLEFGTGDIEQAIWQVSRERAYHPVREYLEALEWDSVDRLSLLATEVFGYPAHCEGVDPEPDDDGALVPVLLRKWFVSAVARVFEPGCKMDTMLVLYGHQGIGKSRFFRTLASPAWFSDTAIDISKPADAAMALREVWIHEWAELETMLRARDEAQVKSFLSSPVDRFRRPYGRTYETHPRSSVNVGTTNQEEFLNDPTGNRRYWPVAVERIDIEKVRAWRDQLWAQAVAIFRADVASVKSRPYGEDPNKAYHLDASEAQRLVRLQRRHERRDPWEQPVRDLLEGDLFNREVITTAGVLHKAIQKPMGQWTKADEMRVGSLLLRMGYSRTRKRDDDGAPRWVYVKSNQKEIFK